MFRPRRTDHPPDPRLLDLRIAIFIAGAVFGFVGMARGNRTIIGIGIAVLTLGILLQIVLRRRPAARDAPPEDGEGE